MLLLLASGMQIFNAHPSLYWGAQSNFAHPWLAREPGFPSWATFPTAHDLATGRRWHFFAAWLLVVNGALYLTWSFLSGHVRRDLVLAEGEWRKVGATIVEHARLHFPRGEAAARYNVLQKLAYLYVVLIAAPGMVLTGLAMSPRMDATWPFLFEMLGGRQSARSVHFLLAGSLVLFVLIHLVMVLLTGPLNEVGSMITGRFTVEPERAK